MICKKIYIVSLVIYLMVVASYSQDAQDSVRVDELITRDTVNLNITGPSNDVAFYMNGMVFLSNTKFHQKMIPDHITFGAVKAYFVPLEYISLESSRPLFINDDFPYSPGGMSFTRDYRHVYFTKTVELQGRRNVEKIFEMSIINGEASEHKQLAFTGDPSRYLHPAISLDDSFMIFSSDRTPSYGGLDLFISRKTPSGWSAPLNMGESINTSGHEWYPYLDQRNNLYFSSSGHMGYGGYDVYVCYFNGSDWNDPQNLTEYVNGEGDELGFSIHPNRKMALFSRVTGTDAGSEVLQMSLNDQALLLSGMEDPQNQDISRLLKELIQTGYTAGRYTASAEDVREPAYNLSAQPLLSEEGPTEEPPEEPVEELPEEPTEEPPVTIGQAEIEETETAEPVQPPEAVPEEEPVIQTEATEPSVEEEPQAQPRLDPNRVIFRVQILSTSNPNTMPAVTIDGTGYQTFEYFYKGAYRITVGEFESVQDASAFRIRCRNAGYDQAFVAAFRGSERELDPAVFRR